MNDDKDEPEPQSETAPRTSAYQRPDSELTLREGLAVYFEDNPGLLDPDDEGQMSSDDAAELFRNHDVVHVVFGTNTSVEQEAMTDTWAMAATDVGVGRYMKYLNNPEAMKILEDIGYLGALWLSIRSVPAVFGVLRRSWRMRKRWPWREHDRYLDVPLAQIRREFGIDVFQP